MPVDVPSTSADHLRVDPKDEQPDPHAVARQQRATKRRRGMQVTGRSTKTVLPDVIARRGQAAGERLRKHASPPGGDTDDEDEPD